MNKKRALLVVFVVLIPFLSILLSYKVVFNFADYGLEQQKTIDFLEDKKELKINMTKAELSHLEDVKGVIKKVDYAFYFLLLVCALIFIRGCKDKRYSKKLLFYGGIAAFSLVVLFLFFVLINFSWLFDVFHQVFFPQGNWIFSTDSYLIQTFPITFFISMIKKIVFLGLILASVFISGGIYLKYVKKEQKVNMLKHISGLKAWLLGVIILVGIIILLFLLLCISILLLPIIIVSIIFAFFFSLVKRKKKRKKEKKEKKERKKKEKKKILMLNMG